MKSIKSAERVSKTDASDNYVFQRSLLAYVKAAEMVSGDVLEIGTGSGYGISIISSHVDSFITIDKAAPSEEILSDYPNVEFHQMSVPPLSGIESNSVDYVISFQVIEHIKNDFGLIAEVYRVLRPGGKLIISTPNRCMSLTRNPWHVREYSIEQFRNLVGSTFTHVEAMGVFGDDNVDAYYQKNRASVEAVARFDPLKLQYRLPRALLKLPYNILNRINRRRLLVKNRTLTSSITMENYHIAPADKGCYDLFFVAVK